MFIENELIELRWQPANINKYSGKGYKYTKIGDVFFAKAKDVLELSSGMKIPVICDYCENIYYPTARNYSKHLKKGGKDCCFSCRSKKTKITVKSKYGVDNVAQVKEIKEKIEKTCLERYGTFSPLENKEIFEKTKKSFNQHYNVDNGIADLRKIKELNEKIIETNTTRYGGSSPFCSEKIRKEIRDTLYANGTCPTSKKQIQLREMIENIYGNCELNYPCDKLSLDCMVVINGTKIDIEYDGYYWHKDTQEKDKKRDYFVESQGYKVLRIVAYSDRLPTKEELVESINYLLTTNKKFNRIELNKY